MLANISQPLLVEQFYFLLFCNIFFYNQLAFVFYLLRDFYIVCDHIVSFCFSLLRKEDLGIFHKLFLKDLDTFLEPLFIFLITLADEFSNISNTNSKRISVKKWYGLKHFIVLLLSNFHVSLEYMYIFYIHIFKWYMKIHIYIYFCTDNWRRHQAEIF